VPSPEGKPLFRLAVVAIVKDEGRYLEEWLAYHILLGCEHFYLFDNGSTDNSRDVLKRFITYGYVSHIEWPLFPGQIDAYNYAVHSFGHLCEWMTFMDVDEFVVLKQHRSIPEVLATVDGDQLLVFWKTFGHSGHRSRPPGLVIENYVHCQERLSLVTKAFARPARIVVVQVHNCITADGRTVNDRGAVLREDWKHPEPCRSEQLIRINHYFTRSYQDYEEKISRGQVDGRTSKVLEPFEHFNFASEDHAAAAFAPDVRGWLTAFCQIPVQPHRYAPSTQIGSVSTPREFMLYSEGVAQSAIEDMAPASGRMGHYLFGRIASFEDLGVGPKLAEWARARLPMWVRATNGSIIAMMGNSSLSSFELRNGGVRQSHGHMQLDAVNEDPQLVATVDQEGPLAYYWLAAVVAVPEDTTADLFAFGLDAHDEERMETRMLEVPRGLMLLMTMINDTPLRIRSGRLDPGSTPGRYDIWEIALVRSL
jgi:hypothetical protein